jgi:hypothetical protein
VKAIEAARRPLPGVSRCAVCRRSVYAADRIYVATHARPPLARFVHVHRRCAVCHICGNELDAMTFAETNRPEQIIWRDGGIECAEEHEA